MYEGSEIMAIFLLIAIQVYLFYLSYSYFSNTTEPFEVEGILSHLSGVTSEQPVVANHAVAPLKLNEHLYEVNPGKNNLTPHNTNRHQGSFNRERGENSQEPPLDLNKQSEQLYEARRQNLISQEDYNKGIIDFNKKVKEIQLKNKGQHFSDIAQPCLAGCSLDNSEDLHYECLRPEPNSPHDRCLFDTDCLGCGEMWPYHSEATFAPLYSFDIPLHEKQALS